MMFIQSIKNHFKKGIKSGSTGYVIFGMHRSGTSLISRILESKGIVFKNISKKYSKSNKFGHYEDKVVRKINSSILKSCGGSWDNPPKQLLYNGKLFRSIKLFLSEIRICKIIKSYSKSGKFWAIKDPQQLLTFNFWKKYLSNQNILIVGVFRRPESVISSLISRDSMKPSEAMKLWKEYNLCLLHHIKKNKYILFDYDDLLNNKPSVIKNLNELGKIKVNIQSYIDKSENHSKDNFCYDEEANKIYSELKRLSL